MRQITIHEAETQFSQLISFVENGEEITIVRQGQPVAKLMPVRKPLPPRKPGSAKGKFRVPPEFFAPLPDDILESFEK